MDEIILLVKKQVSFETINNKKVFNILTEPENSDKKLVIMSHGFRGTSVGPARTFVDFEMQLVQLGIGTLRFDQPGSGNSDGDFVDSSFSEWVEAIVYFANKYLHLGFRVCLLGQSMGATASVIATADTALLGKIPCMLLWVPDPKSTYDNSAEAVYEEAGQKYKGSFWQEAREANFFRCLEKFTGGIHLVYGESDKYVSNELREQVIDAVVGKGQAHMILKGQDHSPWEFAVVQQVYSEEIEFLKDRL